MKVLLLTTPSRLLEVSKKKLQVKGEALFDTPFMMQSYADSMKKKCVWDLPTHTANLVHFNPN